MSVGGKTLCVSVYVGVQSSRERQRERDKPQAYDSFTAFAIVDADYAAMAGIAEHMSWAAMTDGGSGGGR